MLQAWFHRLHSSFTARRAGWLTNVVHKELLGRLPEELQEVAELSESAVFVEVRNCVSQLEGMLQGSDQSRNDDNS